MLFLLLLLLSSVLVDANLSQKKRWCLFHDLPMFFERHVRGRGCSSCSPFRLPPLCVFAALPLGDRRAERGQPVTRRHAVQSQRAKESGRVGLGMERGADLLRGA